MIWVWVASGILFLGCEGAWAARLARVDIQDAEVRESPNLSSQVIEKLRKETEIVVSNEPIQGFRKTRTPSGAVGWIDANAIMIQPKSTHSERTTLSQSQDGLEKVSSEKTKNDRQSILFRIFGGIDLYSSPSVVVNYPQLGQAYHYGVEGLVYLSQRAKYNFGLVVRAESILESLSLTDSSSGTIFKINLMSIPVMAGLEFELLAGTRFTINFGLLGGAAVPTQIQAVNVALPAAVDQFMATHFVALAKVDLGFKLSKATSLFIELGYRYDQTPPLGPPTQTAILQQSFSINLSGFDGGVGLSFGF